jgi:hypothetical protein
MFRGLMLALGNFEFSEDEGVTCSGGPPCYYYRWHEEGVYTCDLVDFSRESVIKAREIVEQQITEDDE